MVTTIILTVSIITYLMIGHYIAIDSVKNGTNSEKPYVRKKFKERNIRLISYTGMLLFWGALLILIIVLVIFICIIVLFIVSIDHLKKNPPIQTFLQQIYEGQD